MKRTKTIIATLMACILLVGCASNTAPEKEETVSVSAPEAIAVIPETMEPIATTEATEVTEATEPAPFEFSITPVITEAQNTVMCSMHSATS